MVNNLYLDTPDRRFYYDTKYRKLTRFKPRVRYYGTKPDEFVMLELKNKHNSIIWKKGAGCLSNNGLKCFLHLYPDIENPVSRDCRTALRRWLVYTRWSRFFTFGISGSLMSAMSTITGGLLLIAPCAVSWYTN